MHVAIVGNGVTGVTAATRIRQKQPTWKISLISGESTHHYSRPALMYIFMGHMMYRHTKPFEDAFWEEQRLELIRDWVTGIDTPGKRLMLYKRQSLAYDRLLIATGSKPNRIGCVAEHLAGVQGLYGLPDLQTLYENVKHTRRAVITGGGLIGIELAEMLHGRGIEVTLLIKESSYWNRILPPEESAMVSRIIEEQGIRLIGNTRLREILDNGSGRVGGVLTDAGERIDCDFVGTTIGVSPNIDLLRNTSIETGRGVLVDDSFRTSVTDVFAAGDCAEIVNRNGRPNLIQQVWYTGKLQGEVAGSVIAGEERTYAPGIWYNSAKFFDLEYQVYGQVNLGLPGEKNLYWEHPGGRASVRIVYTDEGVIGFNFMGARGRHRICERWIVEQRPLSYVLEHLDQAEFDPEFAQRVAPAVRRMAKEQAA
ncbi:MAG: FAD-dependent oxidoreductase [candidate division Zixibacteria bacterium]|nr:FAD-dependent oxidoreductase [candidate division Zixibacteria bacterium]